MPCVAHVAQLSGKMPEETATVLDQNEEKKKTRRRRNRKSKKVLESQKGMKTDVKDNLINGTKDKGNIEAAASAAVCQGNQRTTKSTANPPKSQKKSRKRPDRYFGRFCCKICRKSWESAFVFTRAGTKKVLFKQRCKNCDHPDAWVFPYDLELLKCSQCNSQICECVCEECGKLKHFRYKEDPNTKERTVDDSFEYCHCERRSNRQVGGNIRKGKPHLSQFCQKCLSGHPCVVAHSDSYEPGDNEPGDNEP